MKKDFLIECLLVVLVVFASSSAGAKIKPKYFERQDWAKVSTANFTVLTDQGESVAFKLAEKLEMFRSTSLMFTDNIGLQDARPIKVIATKRKKTYKFLGNDSKTLSRTSGFYNDKVSGNYAILNASTLESKNNTRLSATSVLFHEYTHYLTANLTTANMPYWYNEGLADFLSATQFPDKKRVKLGLPLNFHLRSIYAMKWMPMEKLLKANHISYKKRKDRYRIYSQGWLMVHYFKTQTDQESKLTKYLNLLIDGKSVDEAFLESFEMGFTELDELLKSYAKEPYFAYTNLHLTQPLSISEYTSEKLAPEQILFELGEVMLNARTAFPEARSLFERVLELNPEHADALAGLANTLIPENLDKAQAIAENAKLINPNSAWVSTINGHIYGIRSNLAETSTQKDEFWNKAVQNYNHAINSDGVNVEAINAAANLYLSKGNVQKALELTKIAYGYAPTNYSIRCQLIYIYHRLGMSELMSAMIKKIKTNHHMSDIGMQRFDDWLERITRNKSPEQE